MELTATADCESRGLPASRARSVQTQARTPVRPHLRLDVRAYPPILFFALCGTALRIIVDNATEYMTTQTPYSALFRSVWSNCMGSFVMGSLHVLKDRLDLGVGPFARSVATAFGTGLCGCWTTYSGWMQHAGELAAEGTLQSFVAAAATLVVGLSTALQSFRFGLLAASLVQKRNLPPFRNWTHAHALLGGTVCLCMAIGMGAIFWENSLISDTDALAMAVSMPGVLLRYELSRRNNKDGIPWMTLLANVTGSVTFAALSPLRPLWIRGGIRTGLCGALTTVSTFVLEVHTRAPGAKYAAVSLLVTQAAMIPLNIAL